MLHSFRTPLAISTVLLVGVIGCASGAKGTASTSPTPAVNAAVGTPSDSASRAAGAPAPIRGSVRGTDAPRRDRQVLTRDEIRATQYTNAYDVILALRGNWLRSRTAESVSGKSSTVQVYLDTQRLTGVDELKTMMPTNIASIRFMDPLQASARYGMDHGAGAILVTTAKP